MLALHCCDGSLPESVGLSRGRLEVSFRSVGGRGPFVEAFEHEAPPSVPKDADEVQTMFAESMEPNAPLTRYRHASQEAKLGKERILG